MILKRVFFLVFCTLIFFGSLTAESEQVPSGTLIVTYQTEGQDDRIDRIRFVLVDENKTMHYYPKANSFVEDLSQSSRRVVVKNLNPGIYHIKFLVPNSDNFLEVPPVKELVISELKVTKFDQIIKTKKGTSPPLVMDPALKDVHVDPANLASKLEAPAMRNVLLKPEQEGISVHLDAFPQAAEALANVLYSINEEQSWPVALVGDNFEGDFKPESRHDFLHNPFESLGRPILPLRTDEERFIFEHENKSPPSSKEIVVPQSIGTTTDSALRYRVILDPIHRTKYFPQVQVIAPVVQLNVRAGDAFKKGDLILQLDPAKYLAFLSKTLCSLEKAKEEFRSKERLYLDGNASYFDYIEAQSNLATAEAEVVFAQKNLEAIEIVAPYDGKVASLSIYKYELPLENKEMLEIINDSMLTGKILLPSKLVQNIKIGQPVQIVIDETQESIETSISNIAAAIEPSSSTIKVEVQVDNTKGNLKAGMSGYAILK